MDNMEQTTHSFKTDLIETFGINPALPIPLVKTLDKVDSSYLKDIKLNVKTSIQSPHFKAYEGSLIAMAIAVNANHSSLTLHFKLAALEQGATENMVAESIACASLLAINNVMYRFKHFLKKEHYDNASPRMRMSIMMNPSMGKECFELISLAVSAVNGCERCVQAHEHSLSEMGCPWEKIFDSIRIASSVHSLCKLL